MALAPYIMYGKWALEVLDHEVPKIGQSINLLFILLALFQLIGIFLVWQGFTTHFLNWTDLSIWYIWV